MEMMSPSHPTAATASNAFRKPPNFSMKKTNRLSPRRREAAKTIFFHMERRPILGASFATVNGAIDMGPAMRPF